MTVDTNATCSVGMGKVNDLGVTTPESHGAIETVTVDGNEERAASETGCKREWDNGRTRSTS